jgi:arogenate dehydrogenase (NADP+), plant
MLENKKISIVGFGRFGQLLASILAADFTVQVFDNDSSLQSKATDLNVKFVSLDELLQAETIFYCVPISTLKQIVTEHLPLYKKLTDNKTIIDVLSVKSYPKKIFEELLPSNYQILLTHPMFGPDSVRAKGLSGQTIVIDRFRASEEIFSFWSKYFANKKLNVVEMTAEEHDRLAAQSQGVTHIVGRILDEFGFEPTAIDTLGTKKLYEIKEQTCNDTWQLFVDLQTLNPHTAEMRNNLASAFSRVLKRIELP